jgi:LuxR family transcriptional regulator, maltose regulon positive regulatory protein
VGPQHGPPAKVGGLVGRQRLVTRLRASGDADLILVAAPAGYGKTTLLCDWANQEPRPIAWLSLDHRHDDPALLLASVIDVLNQLEPVDPAVREALAVPLPDIDGVALPRLQATLHARAASFVLVVDDVHCLTTDVAIAVVEGLLDCLPSGSQLVLASRAEPQLPLGRLRAHRRLVELNQADLAMTPGEAGQLFALAELALSPSQLDALVQRTEGWPAALYLASLALSGQDDPEEAMARFAGDDRFLVDYLRDVFLAGISKARLRFLRQTSVLDRMSGELCDTVLESSGSGRVLKDLSRSNLLLTRLDRHDEWYRFHGLLREVLLAELRRTEPDTEAGLHSRASAWYAEREDFDHAIDHAIEARDIDAAGKLIWDSYPIHASHGRVATIDRWLERFDDATIASSPGLALAATQASLTKGDGETAERWVRIAQAASKDSPAGVQPEIAAGLLLAGATIGRDGVEQMGLDASRAYRSYDEVDPWRSLCCFLRGTAIFLGDGESTKAHGLLEEGTRRGLAVPLIEALCLAQRAMLTIDDDSHAAAKLAWHARAPMERHGLLDYPTVALVFAVLALCRAREGRVEGAHEDAATATRLLARLRDFIPWYEAETRIVLAWALMRLDDRTRARDLLAEASTYLERTPDAVVLRRWREQAAAELAESSSEAGLTRAELRVMQFLPTHFSFREIAERLYVSPNTIKTQAQSIYRKLDVSTRGEAVDRARSAGLIDESPRSGDSQPEAAG